VSQATPDSIIDRLKYVIDESAKGVDALYQAEINLAELEMKLDSAYQQKFIDAGGTVADRQAVARLQTNELRFEVDVAKAQVNRVKAKIRQLSDTGTLTAVMAKQIELTWKHA
jgi:hypothetical protein